MLWGVASFSSLLVKKVERACPHVLLSGFGPGAGCEDIFLAARCQTLLSRRPTRQSQLLHVYTVVLAYVSSLLGFPCETVTGGGLRHPTWCARLPNGFHDLSREFTNCFFSNCV